jgi:hypothetical protein
MENSEGLVTIFFAVVHVELLSVVRLPLRKTMEKITGGV